MLLFDEVTLFWIFAVIQPCGLITAWLTRRQAGGRRQAHIERLFWLLLVLVTVATMAAMLAGRGVGASWIFGAATLGAMILLAIWDCRPSSASASHPRWY